MTAPRPFHENLPADMVGFDVEGFGVPDSTSLALARSRLLATSQQLISSYDAPQEIRLEYTPAGATEPYVPELTPLHSPSSVGRRGFGQLPIVIIRRATGLGDPVGSYDVGMNTASATGSGIRVIDTLHFKMVVQNTLAPLGAIAILHAARCFTRPSAGMRRPSLDLHTTVNKSGESLRALVTSSTNKAGDHWVWRAT